MFQWEKELKDPDAPHLVRQGMLRPPAWLEVREAPVFPYGNDLSDALDEGEKEAISLAAALHADTLLLMDDRTAVREARHKGLAVTGTLGVLEAAAQRGVLDLATLLTVFDRQAFTVQKTLCRACSPSTSRASHERYCRYCQSSAPYAHHRKCRGGFRHRRHGPEISVMRLFGIVEKHLPSLKAAASGKDSS